MSHHSRGVVKRGKKRDSSFDRKVPLSQISHSCQSCLAGVITWLNLLSPWEDSGRQWHKNCYFTSASCEIIVIQQESNGSSSFKFVIDGEFLDIHPKLSSWPEPSEFFLQSQFNPQIEKWNHPPAEFLDGSMVPFLDMHSAEPFSCPVQSATSLSGETLNTTFTLQKVILWNGYPVSFEFMVIGPKKARRSWFRCFAFPTW
jgi:hypothetical protein